MILPYALILVPSVVILLNVISYRLFVKKALAKYIIPKLKENDLQFISYKWPGFLSTGDFSDDSWGFTFISGFRRLSNFFYADIVYYTPTGQTKRVTARIDTFLLFIDKVSYSADF